MGLKTRFNDTVLTYGDSGPFERDAECETEDTFLCVALEAAAHTSSCLHLEICADGSGKYSMKKLPPEGKAFDDPTSRQQTPRALRTMPLTSIFEHQYELPPGKSLVTIQGKIALAAAIAPAMNLFSTTPWEQQSSFTSSDIHFVYAHSTKTDDSAPFQLEQPFIIFLREMLQGQIEDETEQHDRYSDGHAFALGALLLEIYNFKALCSDQGSDEKYEEVEEELSDLREHSLDTSYIDAVAECLQQEPSEWLQPEPSGNICAQVAAMLDTISKTVESRTSSHKPFWGKGSRQVLCKLHPAAGFPGSKERLRSNGQYLALDAHPRPNQS